METFRSLFYAPQFVALHGGHFLAEDLAVSVRTAGGGATTTGSLLSGEVEVSLGGLMRSFELADRGAGILVHFAEVNSRNGFFLLSRTPRPHFRWRTSTDGHPSRRPPRPGSAC
jgi:NitT/TauT family transport system substrate-binding protein